MRMIWPGGLAIVALAALLPACSHPKPPVTVLPTVNSIETIVDDMRSPHGVPPSFDWATGPRIGMGNDTGGFQALTAWGQLYEDEVGNPATNTRVQTRDMKTYVLSMQDGQWHRVQDARLVEGAAYREDFAGDVNVRANVRYEADGSLSVTAGGGYNYHFWPSTGRASIDPDDIAGVFTTVQARLMVDDLGRTDDRARARYLLSVGGDYWQNLTAQWDNWKTNGDIGTGRFKYVGSDWGAFNMVTLSEKELRRTPPPLE